MSLHSLRSWRRARLAVETLESRVMPDATLSVGPSVDISRAAGNQSETAIAINPTNPLQLFAVSNDEAGTTAYAAYSRDGGTTWTHNTLSGIAASCCDQQVAWDQFGNLFMVYITSSGLNAVVVRSTDGGATFTDARTIATHADQPSIAVGPSNVAGVPGSVWVSTTNSSGQIVAAGARVMGLNQVGAFSTTTAVPGGTNGDFGSVVVGPNGQVMVNWQRSNSGSGPDTISESTNPNGLASPAGFGSAVAITSTNVGGFAAIPAQPARSIDAEGNLAWDRSGGTHNGRVYLVYTDRTTTSSADTNIYVRYSDNNGATWSGRVLVDDGPTTKSHFNPALAVDQTTGNLAVTWYDCRNSAANNTAQIWGAVSTDGATFGANVQISVGTSNGITAGSFNFGDYDTMDFSHGVFYRTWADNSPELVGNPDRPRMDLATARVTVSAMAGPADHFDLSAPAGSAAGTAFSITVTARDHNGNVATGYRGTVTFSAGPGYGLVPDDYTFTAADAGRHTFTSNATLYQSGTQTVTATDTAALFAGSANVLVTPGPAAYFDVTAPPLVTAGQAIDITVTARDQYGNVAPSYTGTVTLYSTDPQVFAAPQYTFAAADAGVYTFPSVQVLFTAGPQSIYANDGSISGGADFTVTPGAAVQLVLSGPSSVSVGVAFTLTVTAYDAYGNIATGYLGTVHFDSTDPAAALPPDYPFQPTDQGSAPFSVTLNTPGPVTVTVTDALNGLSISLDLTVS